MVNSSYENLEVWNKGVEFAVEVIDTVENLSSHRKHFRLLEQIEASASSIAMNTAEGKGRFSRKEFIHYPYIARGSLYETLTLLEIFKRKGWVDEERFSSLKSGGAEIAAMLNGLINSIAGR